MRRSPENIDMCSHAGIGKHDVRSHAFSYHVVHVGNTGNYVLGLTKEEADFLGAGAYTSRGANVEVTLVKRDEVQNPEKIERAIVGFTHDLDIHSEGKIVGNFDKAQEPFTEMKVDHL